MGYIGPVNYAQELADRAVRAPDTLADEPALRPDDEAFDVVIVGLGCAGVCAAIEAADQGASVLVLDRFYGGGSTEHSGGVVYAGGGTSVQAAAGVTDTPEDMFAYLSREVGRAVTPETLRRFVDGSPEMIAWLERQGVEFDGSLCPYKTSYPTNEHYLYYSGNEQVAEWAAVAKPAPRGHRTHAKNFSGAVFFARLKTSALAKGVVFRPLCEVTSLITERGTVVGVEYQAPDPDPGERFKKRVKAAGKLQIYRPPVGTRMNAKISAELRAASRPHRVRARNGVVLTTGGYHFDRDLVERFAPAWLAVEPMGAGTDDGAALHLTADLRAARSHLDKMSGWRFIAPPSAFMKGLLVDRAGVRVGNEQLYGATLSKALVEEHGATGWLVVDAATWKQARGQIHSEAAFFHVGQLLYVFSKAGHTRGRTLEDLAGKVGIDAAGLVQTVSEHNAAIAAGAPDAFNKGDEYRAPLSRGPFYGVDCSAGASMFLPFLFISLGGLVVDEATGVVQRVAERPIDGLYAAGRAAVGICSNSYVSGLSLADAVFSGRRAGAHAANRVSSIPNRASGVMT